MTYLEALAALGIDAGEAYVAALALRARAEESRDLAAKYADDPDLAKAIRTITQQADIYMTVANALAGGRS